MIESQHSCIKIVNEANGSLIKGQLKLESIHNLIYNLMQEDSPIRVEPQRNRHTANNFSYNKPIFNWDDFRKTFKGVKFDESLNAANDEELSLFWERQLEALANQNERICILVPSKVAKADSKDQPEVKQTKNEKQMKPSAKNAQRSKGKDQKVNNDVPLQQRVFDCAMNMITKSFKQLDYDYSSLFLGNDKQLLIYRRCFYIQKYIQKYRLPKTFEKPFEQLIDLSKHFFDLKVKRNKAFSTFNTKQLERSHKEVQILQQKIDKSISDFKPLFKSIITDFLEKQKCRELVFNNIPEELGEFLKPYATQNGVVLVNRYQECDNDEFKDIIIIKKDDPRLKQGEISYYEERKVEYIYIDPVKQPEPPKDIRDLTFLKMDLAKQCYKYRFDLPLSTKENPVEGLFIRSEHGSSECYQLNIDVEQKCKQVDVDIYPYRLGKSTYEIYIWNKYGATQSTDKIVLYNELPLPNSKGNKIKNYSIYFLGKTQAGLLADESKTVDEFTKFTFQGKVYYAKYLSLGNAAIICDAHGDAAGWGEMYYPDEQEKKEDQGTFKIEEVSQANLKIETPCLLLSGKQIRKVSCGMGYYLMLSTFGSIFSMGFNQFGQLGHGNYSMNQDNMNPRQICRFTNTTSPFITDIHATVSGASFAISQGGHLYRWGFNQVDETQLPIFDRFNSIINYSTATIYYKSCNPTRVGKSFIQGIVKQVEGGSNFYIALNNQGIAYAWGDCNYLGIKPLKDKDERVVGDIINPIEVMRNIKYISAGFDHCIAITYDKRIIGWGNSTSFSKKVAQFANTPVDLTQEYGGADQIKFIKAGSGFTAFVTTKNVIKIIGNCQSFSKDEYPVNFEVMALSCSHEQFLGVLGQSPK